MSDLDKWDILKEWLNNQIRIRQEMLEQITPRKNKKTEEIFLGAIDRYHGVLMRMKEFEEVKCSE